MEIEEKYWEEVGAPAVSHPDDRSYCQRYNRDFASVAIIIEDLMENGTVKVDELSAGEVFGINCPVPLTIYTFEDNDYVYVAHYINEIEHQCYLWRHNK
jgi:hypothetical protein